MSWSERRAFHAIRIAALHCRRSKEFIAEQYNKTGYIDPEAIRQSQEIVVSRSTLESLRNKIRGQSISKAIAIIDYILSQHKET